MSQDQNQSDIQPASIAGFNVAGSEAPVPINYNPNGSEAEIEVQVDNAPSQASFQLFLNVADEDVPPHEFTNGPTHIERKPFPRYVIQDVQASDLEGLVVRCIGRLGLFPDVGTKMRLVFWQANTFVGEVESPAVTSKTLTLPVNFAAQFKTQAAV